MKIVGLDPGPTLSAYVILSDTPPYSRGIVPNEELRELLATFREITDELAIEWVSFYGKEIHAGSETFDTCRWVGRFQEIWRDDATCHLIPRRQVRGELCGTQKAGDAEVRAVLIDRYGGKEAAIGKKAAQGPLYGIASHCWSALAVAIVHQDRIVNDGRAAETIRRAYRGE